MIYVLLAGACLLLYFGVVLRTTVPHPWLLGLSGIVMTVPTAASIYFIEATGVFITEQQRSGAPNGATIGYVAFSIVFIYSALAARRAGLFVSLPGAPPARDSRGFEVRTVLGVSIFVLTLLWTNLALSPIPLLHPEFDRFDYWNRSAMPWLGGVLGDTSSILAFLVGLLYTYGTHARHPRQATLALGIFGLYMFYLILVGHKVSALLLGIILFLTPTLVTLRRLVIRPRHVAAAIGAVSLLFGLSVFHYTVSFNPYERLGLSPVQAVGYRALGLQGHVWWGVFDEYFAASGRPTLSWSQASDGMLTAMTVVAPYRVDDDPERNVRYTMAFPAILLVVAPLPLAVLIVAAIGAVMGFLALALRWSIARHRMFEATLLMQLLLWCRFVTTNGSFSKLATLPNALLAPLFLLVIVPLLVYCRSLTLRRERLDDA